MRACGPLALQSRQKAKDKGGEPQVLAYRKAHDQIFGAATAGNDEDVHGL